VLFVPLADWLARHDVGPVKGALHETAVDNARGRLLTLGAGLFAAGALVFTARNFTLSRRTLELTEQGQVTYRYTAAVVVFLFPLWGTIRLPAYTLVNLLPFIALGWLDLPALKLWAEHSCQLKEESSSNDAELHVVVAGVPLRSPVITCQG
jgi:hypothetical protein